MKKLAVIVFVLGLVALGGVIGLRFASLASTQADLDVPPGEGRLDQPGDVFAGLFRSWSLGGSQTESKVQEAAILRLGVAANSAAILLELRRRELERSIAEAQAELARARAVQPVTYRTYQEEEADDGEVGLETEEESPPEETAYEYEEEAGEESPSPEQEVEAARENLSALEEEYRNILADLDPETLARERERLAEIAVLNGGASRGVQTLLARWGQPYRMVDAGPGLAGLKNQRVLIVPSGALEGQTGRQLTAYVRSGGTIITLAQRSRTILGALPGRPRGFGWVEAESEDTVEVTAAHPAASSCRKPQFSAAVDGFFTALPDGAEIILRSAASKQPVAASYPVDKGLVVATTLYTDWAAMSRSPGAAENSFLRDLVLWAVARGRRLHPGLVKPGDQVAVTFPIVNDTSEMGRKVLVSYLTPEGGMCTPFTLNLAMLPDETEEKTIHVHAPKTPGIWHLVYALVRADGSMLQPWRNAVDLAAGEPAVAPVPAGIGAALTSPGEIIPGTRNLPLTVNLWNYGPVPVKVKCTGPAGEVIQEIPTGTGRKVTFSVPADKQITAKGYYELDLTGPDLALRLSRLITTTPSSRKGD